MTPSVSLLLAALTPLSCGSPPGATPSGPGATRPANQVLASLEELYRSGVTFREFVARAERRKAMWDNHYANGAIPEELLDRARHLAGTWRILAVAEDWCSDSVNTIPYLALLTEQADAIEMRIIRSDEGREIMEAHRTPDGRAATPTVLILDEGYEKSGCWIERPADLQAWALEERPELKDGEFVAQKQAWYDEDGGESTVSEILELIEAAASGEPVCGR